MMASPKRRRCSRCGGVFDEIFFSRNTRGSAIANPSNWRSVCNGCQQTGRDTVKRGNRPLAKARATTRTHSRKYIGRGLASDLADFKDRYGWDDQQMAHDIEYQSGNGCPYCHKQFSSMAHGLADVTLDVVDPQALPFYRTNCRWVCSTCNKAKRDDPPELWARKLQCWAQFEATQKNEMDQWRGRSAKATAADQRLW